MEVNNAGQAAEPESPAPELRNRSRSFYTSHRMRARNAASRMDR